jgi:magnesium-transporting ATPase (P-type)
MCQKQAADIILTDDNFETIIKGVYEGRNVFQKIRRAIAFVLGINLANVLGIFILSLINHVAPLEASRHFMNELSDWIGLSYLYGDESKWPIAHEAETGQRI